MTGRLRTAAAAAVLLAASGCTSADVHDDYTDTEALAAMESFIAESVADLDGFPGFQSRHVGLEPCLYGTDRNEELDGHDTVSVTYEFPEASWSFVREEYPEVLAERWEGQGHEVDIQRDGAGATTLVSATRDDGVDLYLVVSGKAVLKASLGGGAQCTEIDDDFTIPEPAGGVLPEHDRFTDSGPKDST